MGDELLDLVVVGSINVDLVVHSEVLPRPGETVSGSHFERFFGGKGANQAAAAARAGARVGFAGAVGDDAFGPEALADLAAEGIDVAAVRTLPGCATGIAAIVVDAKGENQIALAAGANAAVDAASAEAAIEQLKPGGLVVLSFEVPDAPLAAAARRAAAVGARVLVTPAPVVSTTVTRWPGTWVVLPPSVTIAPSAPMVTTTGAPQKAERARAAAAARPRPSAASVVAISR